MPNLTSVLTDLAGSAITSKLTGGNKSHQNPQPQQGIAGGLTLGSAIDKISSVISSHSSSSSLAKNPQPQPGANNYQQLQPGANNYQQPQPGAHNYQQPQQMSGYPGYPPSSQPYGGGAGGYAGYPQQQQGYPPQQQQGYPPQQQQGYPPQQQQGYPPSMPQQHSHSDYQSPGYPQQPQPPIGFNLGDSYGAPYPQPGGYPPPQQQQQAPYPTGGSPYQPNVGGAPYPTGGAYGPGAPQGYSGGGNVYPTAATDSVNRYYGGGPTAPPQHQQPPQQLPYGGPAAGGGPAYGPTMMSRPSIRPNPAFNANQSAEMLRKAMKGFGCDKHKVVMALCTISNWQRQEVARAFKVMYGKDLLADLRSELAGDFEELVLALMEPPARFDAHQLHKAMAGLGTRESLLIEIMTTRTNGQIFELKNAYRQMYGSDLERDLIGETSGHFKRLLISLCAGGRDESTHVDPLRANQDARKLYRAGEQRLGTDESAFNAILAAQNFPQLRLVFDEYHKSTGHPIEQAINTEFSGDIRDGLLAVVKSIRSRPAYFAELLNASMRGMGTRDSDLIRLVVTRAEIDMIDVREQYQRLYSTSLEKAIASDCSGSYKDGLIQLVRGNC